MSKILTYSKADTINAWGAYQDSLKMSTNIQDLLAYPQVVAAPDVALIFADVTWHENEFVSVRQRYREKNPKYIVAAASLDGLKQQLAATVLKARARIQERLRIAYQDALTHEQGLEAELGLQDTKTNAMQLGDSAVRLNMLSLAKSSRTKHSMIPSSTGLRRRRLLHKSRQKEFVSSRPPWFPNSRLRQKSDSFLRWLFSAGWPLVWGSVLCLILLTLPFARLKKPNCIWHCLFWA